MRIINANLGCKLMLGRQSENNRTLVVFDYSDMAAEFPGGLATIVARRPNDTSAHIVDGIVHEGNVAKWTVSDYELAQDGTGKVQLIYSVSNAVAKTKNWTTEIGESLTAVEGTPPEWMDMFNRLIQAAGEVHQVTEQMRTWRNETEALRNEAEEYCNRVIESESQVDTWHDEVLRAAIAVSDDKALVKQWRDETEQFDIGAERASYEAAHAEQAALASQVNAAHSEATAIAKATEAAESARIASLKAAEATDGATTVVNKTAQATQAAGTATAKAAEAALSATQASNSAMSAANSESGATAKAAEAAQSAQTAAQKAEQITEAAQIATGKAGEASASATAAHASATDAASSATAASASETAAKASETAASTSATQAAQSAQTANTAAQTATQKAADASASATDAATSATNAATSAETASTKAGEAAQSAQAVEETAEQLAESLEQISQNTADIAEHEQAYNALKEATLIHNTASGSIASFVDGAEMPVDEVTAQINPVQDLHGYDHPWPGGGGVNKCNPNNIVPKNPPSLYGMTATLNLDTNEITLSGTPTYTTTGVKQIALFSYTGIGESGYNVKHFVVSSTPNVTYDRTYISPPDNVAIVFTVTDTNSLKLVLKPYFYIGNTEPTEWSPYSNVCPISGFDGLTVWDTGKNMINPSELVYSAGGNNDNVWYGIHLPPDTDFVFSTDSIITGLYVAYSDDDEMPSISGRGWTEITHKYNTTSLRFNSGSHKWYRLMTYEINGVIRDRLYQLELGTTATDYEPYQGETYSITFPSEAGTVYGGTLTIAEDGSGVLTVDRASVDLGTLTWNISTRETTYKIFSTNGIAQLIKDPANNWTIPLNFICSQYKTVTFNEAYAGNTNGVISFAKGNHSINLVDSNFADYSVTEVATALSGVQLVYELSTPIEISFTASEITTLLGENNLWHDANGDISVGYKADTKLYIDGKIAELVARIVNS